MHAKRGAQVCVRGVGVHVSLCTFAFVWRRKGGFIDVLLLPPCSYYKTLTVILLQVCVLFPSRIVSVVFCTKPELSKRKPLQAVEPNLEFGALLQDVYNEMIHNAQYQGGTAILRWKPCAQHIMDLNVSPCCRTCQPHVPSLHSALCDGAEMSPKSFCKFFLSGRLLIPRGEIHFCVTFQLCHLFF